MDSRFVPSFVVAMVIAGLGGAAHAADATDDLATLLGQPADVASSAYEYRADRSPDQNPPESWILLVQYAGLPYDKPPDTNAPVVKQALSGLLWEEVRPVGRVELSWNTTDANIPPPDQFQEIVSEFVRYRDLRLPDLFTVLAVRVSMKYIDKLAPRQFIIVHLRNRR